MAMLVFLPWLRLREPICEGRFRVFPQSIGAALPTGVASLVAATTVGRVLSQYRDSVRSPLCELALLQYQERPLGAGLDEVDLSAIYRFGQHLAVSGLSDRRFLGDVADGYTAAGHYQVVVQTITEPYSGSVSVNYRRKDGHTSIVLGENDAHFVRPAHLVAQGEPNVNRQLLKALQVTNCLSAEARGRVDASITQFLLANSDSPNVTLEAELIATYAALERVSSAKQHLKDMQSKLLTLLSVADGSPWTARLRRELDLGAACSGQVLRQWVKQIYALRGSVAHGIPAQLAQQPWTQQEYLLAGAFIYPLALKCLLAQHGLYSLTVEDVAWIVGLEKLLADRPFLPTSEPRSPSEAVDETPTPAIHRSHRIRWQRQFHYINAVLFATQLSATMREAAQRLANRADRDDSQA